MKIDDRVRVVNDQNNFQNGLEGVIVDSYGDGIIEVVLDTKTNELWLFNQDELETI